MIKDHPIFWSTFYLLSCSRCMRTGLIPGFDSWRADTPSSFNPNRQVRVLLKILLHCRWVLRYRYRYLLSYLANCGMSAFRRREFHLLPSRNYSPGAWCRTPRRRILRPPVWWPGPWREQRPRHVVSGKSGKKINHGYKNFLLSSNLAVPSELRQ